MISINCSTDQTESTTQSLGDTTPDKVKALEVEIEKEEKELKLNRQRLKSDKRTVISVHPTDVIELNIDGEIIATTRQI